MTAGPAIIPDNYWKVASGEATSIIDLATSMGAVAGRPIEVRYGLRRSGDVERSPLSNAALSATGLWGPPLLLVGGLRLTLAKAPEAAPVVRMATISIASGVGAHIRLSVRPESCQD